MNDYLRWNEAKEEARRAPARHARPLRDENPPAREEPYRPSDPIEVLEETGTTLVQKIREQIRARWRGE